MDDRLRRLQRAVAETGSEEDLRAFLRAAYRAGSYRRSKRKDIKKILRKQRKTYGGQGMMFSPRSHSPEKGVANMNASGLQHPDEVSDWDGSYVDWDDALKTALPGESFEVNTYHRVGSVADADWNLVDVIQMEVPSEFYEYGDYYYGPPPEFTRYRNPIPTNYHPPVVYPADDPLILIHDAIKLILRAVIAVRNQLNIYASVYLMNASHLLKGALEELPQYRKMLANSIGILWHLADEDIRPHTLSFYDVEFLELHNTLQMLIFAEAEFFEHTDTQATLDLIRSTIRT